MRGAWAPLAVLAFAVVACGKTQPDRGLGESCSSSDKCLETVPGRRAGVAGVSRGAVDAAERAIVPVVGVEAMGGSEGRIVEGPGYRGVVFPAEAEEGPSAPGGRWTPTEADIAVAERFVREKLPSLAASPSYQQEAVPRIVARLAEYRRQYVGLRGESGELSVWVNFFAGPADQYPDWTRSVVLVRGGGEAYFQLTVDMDAFSCRELRINSSR